LGISEEREAPLRKEKNGDRISLLNQLPSWTIRMPHLFYAIETWEIISLLMTSRLLNAWRRSVLAVLLLSKIKAKKLRR
jgi:hypothetical protein